MQEGNPSSSKKKQILCKFFIRGLCNKEEKCEYLHDDGNTWGYQPFNFTAQKIDEDCPYYSLGFCREGNMCSYNHVKLPESEAPEELPEWFLEYLYNKPLELIFNDFEMMNKEEVNQIKRKHRKRLGITGDKYKYTNEYGTSDQTSQVQRNMIIYNNIKNNNLKILERKVRYFFIKSSSLDKIKQSIKNNSWSLYYSTSIKLQEASKSCDEVILFFYESCTETFYGFARLVAKGSFEGKDSSIVAINVEWLWKTNVQSCKLKGLCNPLDDYKLFINSRDGQELSIDLGLFVCKIMMKKLGYKEKLTLLNRLRKPGTKSYYGNGYDADGCELLLLNEEEKDEREEEETNKSNKSSEKFNNFEASVSRSRNLKDKDRGCVSPSPGSGIGVLTSSTQKSFNLNNLTSEKVVNNEVSVRSTSSVNTYTSLNKEKDIYIGGKLNINDIIYQEIQKTHKLDTRQKPILVTNISNLQVNISQNNPISFYNSCTSIKNNDNSWSSKHEKETCGREEMSGGKEREREKERDREKNKERERKREKEKEKEREKDRERKSHRYREKDRESEKKSGRHKHKKSSKKAKSRSSSNDTISLPDTIVEVDSDATIKIKNSSKSRSKSKSATKGKQPESRSAEKNRSNSINSTSSSESELLNQFLPKKKLKRERSTSSIKLESLVKKQATGESEKNFSIPDTKDKDSPSVNAEKDLTPKINRILERSTCTFKKNPLFSKAMNVVASSFNKEKVTKPIQTSVEFSGDTGMRSSKKEEYERSSLNYSSMRSGHWKSEGYKPNKRPDNSYSDYKEEKSYRKNGRY